VQFFGIDMSVRQPQLDSSSAVTPFWSKNGVGRLLVGLTAKQRKFAWLVASGMSKTKSYAKAYNSQGNTNTQGKNGHVLSRHPAVASAIAEYQAQLLPIAELRAEKMNVLRNLKRLAFSSEVDDRIRVRACVAFYRFCDELIQAGEANAPQHQSLNQDHLIEELLQIARPTTMANRVAVQPTR
jgi:hypothetical protein